MPALIHTCYRIGDIDRSVAFYEALGFEELRRMPIREEAINVFMGLPGDGPRLELTYNHGVSQYDLGTGYNHIAITVGDLDQVLPALAEQGIEPEKPPYTVREGGSRLCFVRDPDGYRIELIERGTDPGVAASKRRSAVIDLGSNSFRLVVYSESEGAWRRTDEIYEAVRIGEGLAATGKLGEEPMRRALAALDVFWHFCRASGLGAGDVDAVATSAIRDATNAAEFLRRAAARTPLAIRVLSMAEEARYGYLAAVNSTTLADGCVLDLGGGSMQLVQVAGRKARASDSWKLGAVRMTERFLTGKGPASRKALDKLAGHVMGKLERAGWLAECGPRLVGVGGTVRNLAAAAQELHGLPTAGGVQGVRIAADTLDELISRLAALPPEDRAKVPGVKPSRADLILAGAAVIRATMTAGGFPELEATEAGLREGVFFERHLRGCGDPPLLGDVRAASVRNLAALYEVDEAHTEHVAALALGLFDELAAAGLHRGDPAERELLWAACMLHDIGMSVDYDDHHKHSRYLILNAGLPGFTPREVALIAQTARFHRKGMPEAGFLAGLIRGKSDLAMLDRMATCVRLAEDPERSRDQLVREAHVRVLDGRAELALVADDDVAVPRWAAARETDIFRRAFGRELVV